MNRLKPLRVVIFSFGFKYGIPMNAQMILDVRFLSNPYWVEELRANTGKDGAVARYVLKTEKAKTFLYHLKPLLSFLIKENQSTGKDVCIAIGCTGGRHRSVAVVEEVACFFSNLSLELTVFHRDIKRDVENIV